MSTVVSQLAEQIREKGRHSTCDLPPLLEQAKALADDSSLDVLTRALAHRAAGNALRLLNKFQPASDHYRDAITLLGSTNDSIELARTLHARLVPLFFLGQFDELFSSAQQARSLFESAGDRRGIARLNVNLAHAYHRLDRHHDALACSESAVSILEEVGDIEGFVAASINSATTLTIMHEFERAEERYQKALQSASSRNMWSSVLLCRHNLAYLRYFAGDTSSALREYGELHVEYEKLDDEWQLCRCWLDEAEILLEVGDLDEAIRAARESSQLARKLDVNLEIGRALLFEAAAHLRLENSQEAMPLLEEAASRFEREGNSIWTAASKLQTSLLLGERGQPALREAQAARMLLRSAGLPHRLAMADVVIGRLQRSAGDTDHAIESFRIALTTARESRSQWMQFHACYELGVTLANENPMESTALLKESERMLDCLWNRLGTDDLKMAFLSDRENVYTHLVRSSLDAPAVAFELSEKARSRVLKEHLLVGRTTLQRPPLRKDETIVEYFITGNDLCIFTIDENGVRCSIREGVIERIKTTWDNLERHLASCSVKWERLRSAQQHLKSTAREHLQLLYRELIEPVISQLRDTVVVVPHGFLHAIPFHGLHDGQDYLSGKHCVVYSPSAVLYLERPDEAQYEKPLFIAFSHSSQSSAREVEQAAEGFPGSTVLVNPTVAALQEVFATPRQLVHIAGHAGIDPVGGKLSWIETPVGRLTGRDLTKMQIRAKTLVVTGCQTARRVIRPGDEWLGLMRAFYASGASTIVSAFWEIRDETARRFATEFYSRFNGGNAPAAVQAASSALQEWQDHPYFWSGFGAFVRRTI